MKHLVLCLLTFQMFSLSAIGGPPLLSTQAEQSGFIKTGRYSEVEKLCPEFQRAFPKKVRCINFGTTPQGRPMLALVASDDGVFTPEQAEKLKRPVVFVQGGIHAGEIDGKDAGFWALRDLLEGKVLKGALSQITLVFVPVFNIDGHERFGRWNRPNQIGPEEMGWRATAQNYNLNRDYMKADAPEMQAMLKLLHAWDPAVHADLHVTDGANFQHDISIVVAPTLSGEPALQKLGLSLRENILADLRAKGSKPLGFYPELLKEDEPSSGFGVAEAVAPPRFSTTYWATNGRLAVLVETHSWKDYATRVRRTYETILSIVDHSAREGSAWLAAFQTADKENIAGKSIALDYELGKNVTTVDFLGYAYTREPSAISGGLVTRYDTSKPEVWHIPFYDQVKSSLTVVAPKAGYLIPAEWADRLAPKLALHGVSYRRLKDALSQLPVSSFRASEVKYAPASFEGRQRVTVKGEWGRAKVDLVPGALFVPIGQPRAKLAMALLEPRAPDSFVAWGDFDTVFEQKEQLEPYVAEQLAESMLAKDPALAIEFPKKVESDKDFASNPQARLDFFYRRSSMWDDHFNLYPVVRVDAVP
jgi:hypothetical protein